MKLEPKDFNSVIAHPIGLGMGKVEWESIAARMLHRHMESNQSFGYPFQYAPPCDVYDAMVNAGLLQDHGFRLYSLTRKSLGLLWIKYGKD
jgi:hypothetical protein